MSNTIRSKTLAVLLIILSLIVVLTSCSDGYKDTNKSMFTVESHGNIYYFDEAYMSKTEAQDFVNKSDKSIADIAKGLQKKPLENYSVYVDQNLISQTYNDKIELSGVLDKSVNYAKYYVQAIMGNSDTPVWFKESFSNYFGEKYGDWKSSEEKPSVKQLADLIIYDRSGMFLDFNPSLYQSGDSYTEIISLGDNYFEYLIKTYGEDKLIELYGSFGKFASIIGSTEIETKSDWLDTLDVTHISDSDHIYYPNAVIDPEFIDLDFDRTVVVNDAAFYYSSTYISDEQALDFSRKINQGMDNVSQFLVEGQIFPPESDQKYLIVEDDKEFDILADHVVLSGVKDNTSSYIAPLLERFYKHDIDPWVRYGLNTFLEKQFSENENFWTENLTDAKEILSNRANYKYLDFHRDWFEGPDENTMKSLSASLVDYIINKYGKPAIVELYNDTINFDFVVGVSFNQVINDWVESLGISDLPFNIDTLQYQMIEVDDEEVRSKLFEEDSYLVYETELAKYHFEPDYLNMQELWNFVLISEAGIADIKEYLTPQFIDYDGKLLIYIVSDNSASSASGNVIYLSFVKENMAEYVHECVHSIQGFFMPTWISEGSATIINNKFSKWSSPPNYGRDFQDLSRRILFEEGYTNLLELQDDMFSYQQGETEQNLRFRCYLLSAGLCEYIEKTYGKEVLLELFRNYNAFEDIMGTDFYSLVDEWVSTLQ